MHDFVYYLIHIRSANTRIHLVSQFQNTLHIQKLITEDTDCLFLTFTTLPLSVYVLFRFGTLVIIDLFVSPKISRTIENFIYFFVCTMEWFVIVLVCCWNYEMSRNNIPISLNIFKHIIVLGSFTSIYIIWF